jgi:hypothetical protein
MGSDPDLTPFPEKTCLAFGGPPLVKLSLAGRHVNRVGGPWSDTLAEDENFTHLSSTESDMEFGERALRACFHIRYRLPIVLN